ncbi:TRAP transporter small permease [Microvirga massiliensis]|uniref:TRAP transporter small permease n=1 Tax=Microvirga massiliensis TaxID=1033741 RepID=UPI000660F5AF|nr:TRAP transporter small permease [Microvirga massiliensis]
MKSLCDRVLQVIDLALIAGGSVVCAVVFVNVIARYVLNVDLAWVNEFGEAVFVWLSFFGGARAVRSHAHLAVIEFVEHIPAPLNRYLFVGLWALTGTMLVLLIWVGVQIAVLNMDQTMSVTGWPVGIVYWAMPVGSFLALLFVVEQILAGEDFSHVVASAYTMMSED